VLHFLWLVPVIPFIGFTILAIFGGRMSKGLSALIGVGSIGLSALVMIIIAISFIWSPPQGHVYRQTLWSWMSVGSFAPSITLYLDALSLVMCLVVTFVAFLIHLYSAEHMEEESEGYSRFFAYMNLFVGSMLTLLLADNLVLLYLGWEGVGLCSYLLIGFWYKDPANGEAARKAFIVTRVGDTSMAIGLFLLFTHLGTLQIQPLMKAAAAQWPVGSSLPVLAAALLLGGALGKSAQLPLQTWLPDAMAGPTPVSALIHAATMVTAGVYLIARTHVLYALAPPVQLAVAIIGAVTLLMAGCSALTQSDIKKILAYSTISQIGYMFLALGVGAWSAAIFHFMTHAFFKALLFLAAGVVIVALHDEHSIFKMGGLRKQLPVTFWTFLIGSASLSALPLVTAGFYSKDLIIWDAWSSKIGSPWLWAAGVVGALLTSLYTFRMVFIVFFGQPSQQVAKKPRIKVKIPLVALAVLSVIGGFVEIPETLGNFPAFSNFMHTALPTADLSNLGARTEGIFQLITSIVSILGIYLAYVLYVKKHNEIENFASVPLVASVCKFWFSDWGFDWLYDRTLVKPFVWLARKDKNDFIDYIYTGIAVLMRTFHNGLSRTQNGRLRFYAAMIAVGAVIIIGLTVLL
jgi:NADH-quinone oxidoreductase subunit L